MYYLSPISESHLIYSINLNIRATEKHATKMAKEYQKKEDKLKTKTEKYLPKQQKANEKEERKQMIEERKLMIVEKKMAEAKEEERQRTEKHREAQRLEEAAKEDLLHAINNATIARNKKLKADEAAAGYEGRTVSSSEKKNTKKKKGARSLLFPLKKTPSPTAKADPMSSEMSIDELQAKLINIYENKHHDNRTDDDATYDRTDDDATYESVDTKYDKEERDQAPADLGLLGTLADTGYELLEWFWGDPGNCGSDTTSAYEPKSVNSLEIVSSLYSEINRK